MSCDFQPNDFDLANLGSQASNLEERLAITKTLDQRNILANCITRQLDEVDIWEL